MEQTAATNRIEMNAKTSRKAFSYKNVRIYFSKATERNVFFVLTFIMLTAGILAKLGLW